MLVNLQHEVPDLILLDRKLPGISGLAMLSAIRHISHHPLVIIMTAYGGVPDAVEASKMGAYDFLIKTVDLAGLDSAVTRALEISRRRAGNVHGAEPQWERYGLSISWPKATR